MRRSVRNRRPAAAAGAALAALLWAGDLAGQGAAGAAAACPEDAATVAGSVEDAGSGLPLPEARVSASWTEAGGESRAAEALTGADGRFRLCLPAEVEATLAAAFLGRLAPPVSVLAAGGRVVERTLQVNLGGGGTWITAAAGPALAPAGPSRVLGVVVDLESGRPVEGAIVTAGETGVQALSDAQGRFLLRDVPPGRHALRFQHVAFGSVSEPVEVAAGRTLEVEARLVPRAFELEPIIVTALRDWKLDRVGFYERKEWAEKTGRGVFLTQKDLEGRAGRIHGVFNGLPGITVQRFCGDGPCKFLPVTRGAPARGFWNMCPMDVFIDGTNARLFRFGAAGRGLGLDVRAGIDEVVAPSEVTAIEIYRSASELPAEFGGATEGCGAVAIWTRAGS